MKRISMLLCILFFCYQNLHAQWYQQAKDLTWYNFRWVSPINETVVFAGAGDGSSSKLFLTSNSGNIWTPIYENNSDDTRGGGQFLNQNVGYMTADDAIMKSIDGGLNWKKIYGAPDYKYIKCYRYIYHGFPPSRE